MQRHAYTYPHVETVVLNMSEFDNLTEEEVLKLVDDVTKLGKTDECRLHTIYSIPAKKMLPESSLLSIVAYVYLLYYP